MYRRAVLVGRTPLSPIQDGPFPQSSWAPKGDSKAKTDYLSIPWLPPRPHPLLYWTLYKGFEKTFIKGLIRASKGVCKAAQSPLHRPAACCSPVRMSTRHMLKGLPALAKPFFKLFIVEISKLILHRIFGNLELLPPPKTTLKPPPNQPQTSPEGRGRIRLLYVFIWSQTDCI